ncbi:MAG TPA: tetratricopeptide repeat protein [Pirellulales bacterium]|nr:tetratricopeptide repeat protein [Pirellulales bacterium]
MPTYDPALRHTEMNRAATLKPLPRHANPLPSSPAWLPAAALVLLAAIVYSPTVGNGFIWDDDDYVQKNVTLTSASGLRDIWLKLGATPQYYPLVHSTFWVEYHLWGLDPRGYHVVNLLLHGASGVLVWRLLVLLGAPGAWLAAAIFAVHPLGVESVAWITERKNVLSCVLALTSLLAYLRFSPPESLAQQPNGKQRTSNPNVARASSLQPLASGLLRHSSFSFGPWHYFALSFVVFVAALLSKTVTASMPAVLLVIYWWKRGRLAWRDLVPLVPLFAVGLAFAWLTVWMEKTYVGASGEEFDLAPLARMLVAGRALWFYAGKLIWPYPLIFFYPRWNVDPQVWWQWLFPAAALSAIAALWLARRHIGRGPLAATLVFAGVLTPALGFFNVFPFTYSFVADHFQYHASVALIALGVAGLTRLYSRLAKHGIWTARVATAGLLAPLSVLAFDRTRVYEDLPTLHANTMALNPTAWVAPQNLGTFFYDQQRYEEAIPQYRKAIEIRQKLVDDFPHVSYYQDGLAGSIVDLAAAQHKAGRWADAQLSYRKALEIHQEVAAENPTNTDYQDHLAASFANIGLLQRDMAQLAEAERSFHNAIAIRQRLVENNPKAAKFRSRLAASYEDLGIVLERRGEVREAEACFRRALEICDELSQDYPANDKYQNQLAASRVDLGMLDLDRRHWAEAQKSFRRAIEIRQRLVHDNPAVAGYREGLAWCYVHLAVAVFEVGDVAEAKRCCRQAIEIRQQLVHDYPMRADFQQQLADSYRDLDHLQRSAGPRKGPSR